MSFERIANTMEAEEAQSSIVAANGPEESEQLTMEEVITYDSDNSDTGDEEELNEVKNFLHSSVI